jgi:PP-loop superfamily ATP-utilizing enzyme
LLHSPRKETHIEVVCGSQSERIAKDFRAAGFLSVTVSQEGYFEGWVQQEVVATGRRHRGLVSVKTGVA